MDSKLYKFDSFCLDPKQRKLLSENKVVPLSSRAFEMLLQLVQKQGEVVEKSEILDKVWSDSFVEESNLVVHIAVLDKSSREQIDFTDPAIVYAALRENDKAFEYLDKAFKKGDTNILLLRTDPRFEHLHSDSRFIPLLRNLNLA